jgi:hypothetical protein
MAKKIKKFLKKAAKAALIGGALYAGAKGLGKRKLSKAVSGTDDAGRGVKWFDHRLDKIPRSDPTTVRPDRVFGGGAGFKKGGRTGKQFGGGLGSTARRDMRSGYYPSDMGMRGGTMYKKGGRVKSRGVAKRGGGAEIK